MLGFIIWAVVGVFAESVLLMIIYTQVIEKKYRAGKHGR